MYLLQSPVNLHFIPLLIKDPKQIDEIEEANNELKSILHEGNEIVDISSLTGKDEDFSKKDDLYSSINITNIENNNLENNIGNSSGDIDS